MKFLGALIVTLAAVSALPAEDPIIRKLNPDGLRYGYLMDDNGVHHLQDTWTKLSDLGRYDAERLNQYHLFTRANPSVSQPLVMGNVGILTGSNFNANRRTVITFHGWLGSATAPFNQEIVPAYLAGEDVNVIVLDWSGGSFWGYNAIPAARAAANFVNWLNSVTGAHPSQYHIVGFSVGGQAAGILAKEVNGIIAYVSGLDPSATWDDDELLDPSNAAYVEVIHTAIGTSGWTEPLGHVDFYPNGGRGNPGCLLNPICDHNRSYMFMAESVVRGGFTGRGCVDHSQALSQNCNLAATLPMGGRLPKTGSRGVFHLRTNSNSPFSQG